MEHRIRLAGELTGADIERYIYLPFEVPEGARRIDVGYEETEDGERTAERRMAVVAFDSRGTDLLTPGFRGWAGGKKPEGFHIAPREASPGFLRGPIQPGQWSLMLACPRYLPGTLSYALEITVDYDPASPAEPVELPNPAEQLAKAVAGGSKGGGRWYRGDLHAHSVHSDGANSVDQIVDYVRNVGLDFFALTDHNTVSHWEDLVRLSGDGLLLIGGEELTMIGGHANVWALDAWVDFRVQDDADLERIIESANARGSMFSVNHPDSPIPWRHHGVSGFQAMEVWNSPWRYYNEPALVRWQYLLNRGERIVAVGGSDSHCVPPATMTQPNGPGEPCTWAFVEGPLTQRSVLDAVERGHVFISEHPVGPFVELRADADRDGTFEALPGDLIEPAGPEPVRFRLHYRGPEGKHVRLFTRKGIVGDFVAPTESFDHEIELECAGRDYVRVEVRGFRGRPDRGEVVHALTNPIYWGRWL